MKLSVVLIMICLSCQLISGRADAFNLRVINNGAGSGNINGDISCDIAPLGQCSAVFAGGTVTLVASSDWKSVLNGWGSPCNGTGSCIIELNADTDVPITFTPNFQAIILGHSMAPNYATLADAYAAANDQYVVAANVYTFKEDLILDKPKYVRFYMGKESGYYGMPATGFTTLQGSLTVRDGAVEIDSLIIQ